MDDVDKLDFFISHFQNYSASDHIDSASAIPPNETNFKEHTCNWSAIGHFIAKLPSSTTSDYKPITNPNKFKLNSPVQEYIKKSNSFTQFQLELFSVLHEYRDIYFTLRSRRNADEIRRTYCTHIVDHLSKSRALIIANDTSIVNKFDIPDQLRDQGLTQAKILVLVPFKNSALKIVETLSSIVGNGKNVNVTHKKRFYNEFTGGELSVSQKSSRPEDYAETFTGNIDDNFKIGISLTKKSVKLYTDFHHSDIIIASPLGLRLAIGSEGEADYDFDFLASIEILILDQAEIFLMQNWDHVLHIIEHVNLQPRKSHGVDFNRVRCWALNGLSKYYRQNLIFSSYPLLQITALMMKKCVNYDGYIRTNNPVVIGTINQVISPLPHIFHRLVDTSANASADERFKFFTQKLLHQCQDNMRRNVLVYIPSYFDFIRIKHHFMSEAISFVEICEYTKDKKVSEARDKFFHNEVNYMLYSERFHFFIRRKIRGIFHIIFYQLPTFPHFYSEICNLMETTSRKINQNVPQNDNICASVTSMYSKFDAPQLASIVSTDRAAQMLASKKDLHMIMVEEKDSQHK